jgi:transposase-like protein
MHGQPTEFFAPQREAALFYGMFLRGRSLDSLRQEIDVSPQLFHKWMRAREYDKGFRDNLARMYSYRKRVLAIFESLVTSDQIGHSSQQ